MSLNTPLPQATVEKLFPPDIDPPEPDVFELGLVLGGTVSAGAYTAGVLDFLMEALDTWTDTRDAKSTGIPPHKVKIKVLTGTSGGGVNAALFARSSFLDFPHFRSKDDKPTGNPFYDAWVNGLQIDGMLDTTDIEGGSKIFSLLNPMPLDMVAQAFIDIPFEDSKVRSYLDDPVRFILTITNLAGVPYSTQFDGDGEQEVFVNRADYARFAAFRTNNTIPTAREDEFILTPRKAIWSQWLKPFALGTCAFPNGFPARSVTRPAQHYKYRVTLIPTSGPGNQMSVKALIPRFDYMGLDLAKASLNTPVVFNVVDGGVTNNEPILLARTALSGMIARSPREGSKAYRAIVLVDPFAFPGFEQSKKPKEEPESLLGVLGSFAGNLVAQARYDSCDLLLAADPDVFSRFIISAAGPVPGHEGTVLGERAIASGGLDAFMGFMHPSFREYDYFLGRRNAQAFLRRHFVLPENNQIFNGWNDDLRNDFAIKDADGVLVLTADGKRHLPIIPLLGACDNVEEKTPDWPAGNFDPDTLRGAVKRRVKAVLSGVEGGLDLNVWAKLYLYVGGLLGEGALTDLIIDNIQKTLANWHLDRRWKKR